jgi:hypothetical protein
MDPVLAQRYTELQSLSTTIASGDDLLTAKKFENAVTTYQVAGGQAAQLIVALNASSGTANKQLQALQSHLASEQTATQAAALAKQLQSIATSAYNTASAVPSPAAAASSPAPSAPSAAASFATTVLWVAVAGGIGTLLYLTLTDPKPR